MKTNEKTAVALIFGGKGHEHSVSVSGAEFVYSLIGDEYEKIPVYISKSGEWLTPRVADSSAPPKKIADGDIPLLPTYPLRMGNASGLLIGGSLTEVVAIPLLHGDFGEDGIVQGALECAGISYVGCDVTTSAICSDKAYTKTVAKALGIPVANWVASSKQTSRDDFRRLAESELGYPMFIKPRRLGSSIGAYPVKCSAEFDRIFDISASLSDGGVMAEELVNVEREIECAYFEQKSKRLFTNVGEIVTHGKFYDYENKYEKKECIEVSDHSLIPTNINNAAKEYSKKLADELILRDLARIDYFLTEDGELIFNEINTMPGFTGGSLYPRLLSRMGVTPKELVSSLITAALDRKV